MLEKIQHINPKEITDLAQMQNLMVLFMNVVESQAKQLDDLTKENQELKNEINRLKGEHGDLPPRKPNTTATAQKKKPQKVRKRKNHKKGPKNNKIEIDNTVVCEIDKSKLPWDAKFQGYRSVIQQDIIFKRNNTLYKVPLYYSKSERRLYSGQLPEDYEGEFGGQLKSWLQVMHHYCDVTQGRLNCLLANLKILISTGTISNIILSNKDKMQAESKAILRAGLETIPFSQMDGTKSWQKGQGKATQIIATPWYSLYYTMGSKSKVDIIWALQGKSGSSVSLQYNDLAIGLLTDSTVPKKDQALLGRLLRKNGIYDLEQLTTLLNEQAPHLLEKANYPKMIELLALAYYLTQTAFPQVKDLISDAGPEYLGIAANHGLCWLHEERHYKKMIPKLTLHQNEVQRLRGQIWDFYKKLLNFKELPLDKQQQQKELLSKEFDTIFTQKTTYEELNDRIEKTYSKKDKLLQVLEFPYLPLHNNCAELAVRRKVRKRDISLHTMSAKGTQVQDAFMSVVETAAKLGINAIEYIFDRITNKYNMPSLADLIRLQTF